MADIDAYIENRARFGETHSGNAARIFKKVDTVTSVLIEGGGDSMRASVCSGMAMGMFETALSKVPCADKAMRTILSILPAVGKGGPSGFYLAEILQDGHCFLVKNRMPSGIFLRKGHVFPLDFHNEKGGDRLIETASVLLKPRDTLISFGNGVSRAADGVSYAADWCNKLLPAYLEAAYFPSISAQKMGELLLHVCQSLSNGKSKDDFSILIIRYQGHGGNKSALL